MVTGKLNKGELNKGEWSESLALLKIINSGLIKFGSDKHKETNNWIEVFEILPNGLSDSIKINKKNQSILVKNKEFKINDIASTNTINKLVTAILEGSKASEDVGQEKKRTFSNPQNIIKPLLSKLGIESLKAHAKTKGDITISYLNVTNGKIYNMQPVGIKSYIGSKPTIINPSSHTLFKYKISGLGSNLSVIQNQLENYSYKSKIQKIKSLGGSISLVGGKSTVYKNNLEMIDKKLPKILGDALLEFYSTKGKTKVSYFIKNNQEILIFKNFLIESMLGIFPSELWNRKRKSAGFISLAKSGGMLFYHVTDLLNFKEFLFFKSCFEGPQSRKSIIFCKPYEEKGSIYIDLALQVRL